jgi:hypothetical protein
MTILRSEDIPQIQRLARIACRDKGRLLRWELHAGPPDGSPLASSFLRVFYAKRFATDGEEYTYDTPIHLGHP